MNSLGVFPDSPEPSFSLFCKAGFIGRRQRRRSHAHRTFRRMRLWPKAHRFVSLIPADSLKAGYAAHKSAAVAALLSPSLRLAFAGSYPKP